MFRTRDFFLLFTAVAFLAVAIGATVIDTHTSTQRAAVPVFVSNELEQASVRTYTPESLSRAERLADMREKIATRNISMSAPADVYAAEDTAPDMAGTSSPQATVPQRCATYEEFAGDWLAREVAVEDREGARVVYRNNTPQVVATTTGTQSVTEKTLFQLPIQPALTDTTFCLSMDVVGIALDGSLIRNQEAHLYSVFGEDTLIGYALDGVPIYGVSTQATDVCGGLSDAGSYRYYLADDRSFILSCFKAAPVSL